MPPAQLEIGLGTLLARLPTLAADVAALDWQRGHARRPRPRGPAGHLVAGAAPQWIRLRRPLLFC
ncbi:MAG: hypothetical protein ACT4O0_15620 [Pseudonocardia sp.]